MQSYQPIRENFTVIATPKSVVTPEFFLRKVTENVTVSRSLEMSQSGGSMQSYQTMRESFTVIAQP